MKDKKEKHWLYDVRGFFKEKIFGWKWFPTVTLISVSIIIFIISGVYIYNGNASFFIKAINDLSIAFVAGGAFTVFLKFFQFARIFKDELRDVICDEDLHIEKSRRHRDNLFINNLDTYSIPFVLSSLKLMVKRIFPNEFGNVLGKDFNDVMAKRIQEELSIDSDNNYMQTKCDLTYTIKPYDKNFLIVEQKISSYFHQIEGPINFTRKYSNWLPKNDIEPDKEPVDIKYFKLGNDDYSERFSGKIWEEKSDLYHHKKASKDISITLKDQKKVKFESKIEFLLSLDSFLYWEYRFAVYTKSVKLTVEYDKDLYLATIWEFAQKQKFDGVDGKLIYKHNDKTIYLPEDKFVLAIHEK